jgi:hypothetical protein
MTKCYIWQNVIFCSSKKPFFAAKSSGDRKYGRDLGVDKTRFVNN